jgi:hypothetical protein
LRIPAQCQRNHAQIANEPCGQNDIDPFFLGQADKHGEQGDCEQSALQKADGSLVPLQLPVQGAFIPQPGRYAAVIDEVGMAQYGRWQGRGIQVQGDASPVALYHRT